MENTYKEQIVFAVCGDDNVGIIAERGNFKSGFQETPF